MNHSINHNEWPELSQGDPLADAVASDWMNAGVQEKKWLMQGMMQGVRSIPHAPASYRSFLQDTENTLSIARSLEGVALPYFFTGPIWMSISLGPGALLHTYADPRIAHTLVQTGKLVNEAALRRLSENQLWLLKLLQPDAWQIGGSGYVHTLQVRLIHAKIRVGMMRKSSENTTINIPIDQEQMLRTWLDFSVVSPQALELLGIEWNDEEKSSVAALWLVVAQLLGLHSKVTADLAVPGHAQQWLNKFNQNKSYPDENSKILGRSMLDAIGQRMSEAMNLPKEISTALMHGFAQHIHGQAHAEAMGASNTSLSSLIPVYVDANRHHMDKLRHDNQYRQMILDRTTKQFDAICEQINGSAAYQQND